MALRAGVVSPVSGQCATRAHEHSRGRQALASAQCSLSFPVHKGTIRPAAAARRCRQESRTAACKPFWRAPANVPPASVSRLSVSCGAGIAQPGEVCYFSSLDCLEGSPVASLQVPCCPFTMRCFYNKAPWCSVCLIPMIRYVLVKLA